MDGLAMNSLTTRVGPDQAIMMSIMAWPALVAVQRVELFRQQQWNRHCLRCLSANLVYSNISDLHVSRTNIAVGRTPHFRPLVPDLSSHRLTLAVGWN